ncbi:MAG: NAD(+) diphosphatase [Robiginitomaculum sp.]|nr:MAG: NAD(+) diphosphatase [Robiginitomaculum sp.]
MSKLPLPKILPFAGSPLDRCENLRRDDAAMRALQKSERALFLTLWRGQVFMLADNTPALLQGTALADLNMVDPGPVLLGTMGKTAQPWFALRLDDEDDRIVDNFPLAGLGEWTNLRAAAPLLTTVDLAIVGRASALLNWHERHSFCANCGTLTQPAGGGIKRECEHCGTEHFPRTDPVVIMLAVQEDQCLMGRQAGWPENTYSALAGFVEQGESLEEACAREVGEEAGVQIGAVRYVLSQPWPFPSSLMIGLIAQALSTDITLDDELEDARWFSRADVRAMLAGTHAQLHAPMGFSAAHHLLKEWAAEEG